ncbi:DcaP family trimeric outer membrane transporter [Algoriphagus sediminis]|uniref:DcaP family trimeric outer membrane transporter n=1 Tax=Algoriphagus sediminis TaxID=3057113 RepID=A0ABT7YDX7_9BACT|nr:DcaP family trimeric outer membrane transporter [Algoriphagus sediminis]MDN3204570.1 DcaP family trimeric outer membrane transporter [Algoriphagus sediminis]
MIRLFYYTNRPILATLVACSLTFFFTSSAYAQEEEEEKVFEFYGHVMTDVGYNFGVVAPNWTDVMRPSRLPSFEGQYGTEGNVYFSVRQTRFGAKSWIDTPLGKLHTIFEWELFGTGVDEGQTTLRLRHAYAEIGKFGAGQYWSPFMDIDVFPNTLEYWGPSGMVFFRNIQVRYMPIQGRSRLTFALERPGASADEGIYADRIELDDVEARFPLPDFSFEYHHGRDWGYVEIAGMLRRIEWEDKGDQPFDLSGSATGWGLNLSTNLNLGKSSIFRGQFVFGEGIQNYMNDAPSDIGIRNRFDNPNSPIEGVPLPVIGIVAFLDHKWNDEYSTSVGYSTLRVDHTDGQTPDSFDTGEYFIANFLWAPASQILTGVELQHIRRQNYLDGFSSNATKIQFSFKYYFSQSFYKK